MGKLSIEFVKAGQALTEASPCEAVKSLSRRKAVERGFYHDHQE